MAATNKAREAVPERQEAMINAVCAARPGAGKPRPIDYGTPYPYWLKGKVRRIYR